MVTTCLPSDLGDALQMGAPAPTSPLPQPPYLTQHNDGHPMVNSKGKLLTLWWITADCYTFIFTVKTTAEAVAVAV